MPKPTRREALQLGAAGAAVAAGGALGVYLKGAPRKRGDNVVVLMSDEHNWRYVGYFGGTMAQTPTLRQIFGHGTYFDTAYCPSPLCMPSRSAFMGGKRVHDLQCYNNCNVFSSDTPTLGGALADQGVHTVLFGKTDVFRPGSELGFSEVILPQDRQPPGDLNISRNPLSIREEAAARAEGYGPRAESPRQSDDEIIEAALEWISTQARKYEPFVMLINLTMPHFPHYVTDELWEKYAEDATLPDHGVEAESAHHPHAADLRAHFQTHVFTEEQIRGHRRAYLGCVEYLDGQVKRVMDRLAGDGFLDRTYFIYTSDHGEMLGKFGMWWKCSLYEDSVRVPLFAMGPRIWRRRVCDVPVDLHDVRATMFAATGAKQPEGWLGQPLQALQDGDTSRVVFSEYHGHGTRGSGFMVRQHWWKYIWYADAPPQLFDLAKDAHELHNLVGEQPEVQAQMDKLLREICDPEQEHERAEAYIQRQLQAAQA